MGGAGFVQEHTSVGEQIGFELDKKLIGEGEDGIIDEFRVTRKTH